jgi:hypothetical protein
MASSWYLYRLLPHRPDFSTTMSDEERAAMGRHVAYWRDHLAAGRVLIFSPVADPTRSWGLAIVRAATPEQLEELRTGDPALLAGIGEIDYLPLPMAIVAGES